MEGTAIREDKHPVEPVLEVQVLVEVLEDPSTSEPMMLMSGATDRSPQTAAEGATEQTVPKTESDSECTMVEMEEVVVLVADLSSTPKPADIPTLVLFKPILGPVEQRDTSTAQALMAPMEVEEAMVL
jgi:hypothetical protein